MPYPVDQVLSVYAPTKYNLYFTTCQVIADDLASMDAARRGHYPGMLTTETPTEWANVVFILLTRIMKNTHTTAETQEQ